MAEPFDMMDDWVEVQNYLTDKIVELLAHRPPCLRGSVLAEALAIYLGDNPPELRARLRELHLKAVDDFIELHDSHKDA